MSTPLLVPVALEPSMAYLPVPSIYLPVPSLLPVTSLIHPQVSLSQMSTPYSHSS